MTHGQQHRHDTVTVVPDVSQLETTREFTIHERDELAELLNGLLEPRYDDRPVFLSWCV